MMRLVALACGLICGAGLIISGLYDPALTHDIGDRQNGALVYGVALFAIVFTAGFITSLGSHNRAPVLGGAEENLPEWRGRKPMLSALIFGVGWGLAGYVPLTAFVAAGALSPGATIFLTSALFGMVFVDLVTGRRSLGVEQSRSIG